MKTSSAKSRKPNELRDKILRASQHLIVTEGYAALSMRRLATAIDYSATTIYLYFENREEIISELGRTGLDFLKDAFESVPAKLSAMERLEAYADAYLRFAEDQPESYRLIFMQDADLAKMIFRGPKSGSAESAGQKVFGLLYEAFVVMKAESPGWKKVDPQHYAEVFWTSLHGIVSLKISCGKFLRTPASTLADLAVKALLSGREKLDTRASSPRLRSV